MLTIRRFTVESLVRGCVTDNPRPRFSFSTDTDRPGYIREDLLRQVVIMFLDILQYRDR